MRIINEAELLKHLKGKRGYFPAHKHLEMISKDKDRLIMTVFLFAKDALQYCEQESHIPPEKLVQYEIILEPIKVMSLREARLLAASEVEDLKTEKDKKRGRKKKQNKPAESGAESTHSATADTGRVRGGGRVKKEVRSKLQKPAVARTVVSAEPTPAPDTSKEVRIPKPTVKRAYTRRSPVEVEGKGVEDSPARRSVVRSSTRPSRVSDLAVVCSRGRRRRA